MKDKGRQSRMFQLRFRDFFAPSDRLVGGAVYAPVLELMCQNVRVGLVRMLAAWGVQVDSKSLATASVRESGSRLQATV
jgi:hypothetical protein